jgi:hypothetical protein
MRKVVCGAKYFYFGFWNLDFGLKQKWIFCLYYYRYGGYNMSEIRIEEADIFLLGNYFLFWERVNRSPVVAREASLGIFARLRGG